MLALPPQGVSHDLVADRAYSVAAHRAPNPERGAANQDVVRDPAKLTHHADQIATPDSRQFVRQRRRATFWIYRQLRVADSRHDPEFPASVDNQHFAYSHIRELRPRNPRYGGASQVHAQPGVAPADDGGIDRIV